MQYPHASIVTSVLFLKVKFSRNLDSHSLFFIIMKVVFNVSQIQILESLKSVQLVCI